jgi:phosphatidylserine/phosphatidylglycerophosphate/cardiolipin synthase-like enzyme
MTLTGSYNLDPRSADLNTECMAVMRSPQAVKSVSKFTEEEFLAENSWQITENFNPDSKAKFTKRIKAFFFKVVPKKIL